MFHDARVPDVPPLLHRHGRIHHDVAPVAVVMEPGDERTRPARQSHRLAETAMPPSLPGGVSPRRRVSPPGGGRSVGGGARRDEVDELGRRAEVHERPGGDGANAKLVPRQVPVRQVRRSRCGRGRRRAQRVQHFSVEAYIRRRRSGEFSDGR